MNKYRTNSCGELRSNDILVTMIHKNKLDFIF